MFGASPFFHVVQKGKTKTPAQDRLLKIVKNDRKAVHWSTAVAELLKNHTVDLKPTVKNLLPKNYLASANSQKSSAVVKFTNDVKPAVQAVVGVVDCAKSTEPTQIKWPNDYARNENVSKIGPTMTTFNAQKSVLFPSSFHLPANGLQACQPKLQSNNIIKKGHDFQVQNRLKINDYSKIIGGKWLSFDLIFGTHRTHTHHFIIC